MDNVSFCWINFLRVHWKKFHMLRLVFALINFFLSCFNCWRLIRQKRHGCVSFLLVSFTSLLKHLPFSNWKVSPLLLMAAYLIVISSQSLTLLPFPLIVQQTSDKNMRNFVLFGKRESCRLEQQTENTSVKSKGKDKESY